VLRRFREVDPLEELQPVVAGDDVVALSKACRRVYLSPAIETYILALVRATRNNPALSLGASPRGSLALAHTTQVLAAVRGRSFVIPDDVQLLIVPTLAHRLILSSQSRLHGKDVPAVLQSMIEQVPVPVEESWSEPKI
jgi:MoxR-like ATPase